MLKSLHKAAVLAAFLTILLIGRGQSPSIVGKWDTGYGVAVIEGKGGGMAITFQGQTFDLQKQGSLYAFTFRGNAPMRISLNHDLDKIIPQGTNNPGQYWSRIKNKEQQQLTKQIASEFIAKAMSEPMVETRRFRFPMRDREKYSRLLEEGLLGFPKMFGAPLTVTPEGKHYRRSTPKGDFFATNTLWYQGVKVYEISHNKDTANLTLKMVRDTITSFGEVLGFKSQDVVSVDCRLFLDDYGKLKLNLENKNLFPLADFSSVEAFSVLLSFENKGDEVVNLLSGNWIGVKGRDSLLIFIERVEDTTLAGYTMVGEDRRDFHGTFTAYQKVLKRDQKVPSALIFDLTLREPGDRKSDGAFSIRLFIEHDRKYGKGVWVAYSGRLTYPVEIKRY